MRIRQQETRNTKRMKNESDCATVEYPARRKVFDIMY